MSKWAEFLNPDVVRARFVRSGLFLVAHEMLVSAIKDHLHDFFADTWTTKDGWKTSTKYREEVLSLDPKKKNDPYRASVTWLRQNGAIDDYDEQTVRLLTDERNRLAHELRNVIGGSNQHDFESLFPKLVALVVKIDKWWVVNVDTATDPDMMSKELDEDGVIPGSQIMLQVLIEVALGQEEKAWALYREFMAHHDTDAN